MILRLLLFLLPLLAPALSAKAKSSEVLEITDIKDWKKELRTKKNVLALFTKDARKSGRIRMVMDSVSVTMRGLATLVFVDCSDRAAKLCKKLKINPKPYTVQHYSSGELNKEYDRKPTETSMELFLRDPLGDLPWSEDDAATDVQHLDYPSFKRLLRKTELPILVMFYAPWCGHCKRMKPEFSQAATSVKGQAILVGIDVEGSRGSGASADYNVTSYPTVLYFERGTFKFKFTGERTATGIVSWLADPQEEVAAAPGAADSEKSWAEEDESPVAHLTVETFPEFLGQHSSVLVMFYAPWCGHCKAMKPEYSAAAALLADQGIDGKLAAVDVTANRALGEKFSVKGFPTVLYFKNGNKTFEHPGLRKQSEIVSFMKDPKEPPPPAPEELPWSEQESSVVHLEGTDVFDKAVKRKKHSLIMFYAPWCGHCKRAKPEFTAAAESLATNNKVLLGAVDCTVDGAREVCGRYGVKGYPTILYFNYGTQPHKYTGARDRDGFKNAMSREMPSSREMTPVEGESASSTGTPSWTGETVSLVPAVQAASWIEDNAPAFVLYYREGCVTCPTIQAQFVAVSARLASGHLTFGAVECGVTEKKGVCAELTEPTLVLHREGGESERYHHDMTVRDMYNFLTARHDEL